MEQTPLAVLAELIVKALVAAGGAATPSEVITSIQAMPEFSPTEGDLAAEDGGPPAWHSRVHTARRHLGDDDLVLVQKRRWVLTAAGQTSMQQEVGRADPVIQPVPFQPSVIAAPLRDAEGRASVMGRRIGDDEKMSVLIELNMAYPGGTSWAYIALRNLFIQFGVVETEGVMPKPMDEYVPARLSMAQIETLVGGDEPEPKQQQRVIHRVWPNFPVHGQMDVSCRTVKADAARRAFNAAGEGVVWAVIDSGIDATHPHFSAGTTLRAPEVADLHRDFTISLEPDAATSESALRDDHGGTGHGTGVASIIAGYLPANYPAAQLDVRSDQLGANNAVIARPRMVPPENLAGMAPQTRLVSLKVISEDGGAPDSDEGSLTVMAALRYVMQVNGDSSKSPRIHGVNLSVGYEFDPQWFACGQSPLCQAVDRVVRSGVVVVVAAGNTGYASFSTASVGLRNGGLAMSINDPGNAERAITVGATHRSAPHTYGVSFFSSKGPTGDGRLKPDMVAPGERVTVAVTQPGGQPPRLATYAELSGTSYAAPHVSGAIAAFLSVRPEFIAQPERVKQILVDTAVPLNRERQFEGAGLVDLMRALQSI